MVYTVVVVGTVVHMLHGSVTVGSGIGAHGVLLKVVRRRKATVNRTYIGIVKGAVMRGSLFSTSSSRLLSGSRTNVGHVG